MTIKRVTVRLIEREMSGALWNPRTRWTKKRILLVFVESSCGAVGCGEAWLTGGTPRAVIDTIEDDIAPRLVGEDPFFMRRLGETLFKSTEMSGRSGVVAAALSAVDTALWDLIGKLTATPLYKLLGAAKEQIPAYASAGLYGTDKTADDLAAEMAGYVEQGFDAVKLKVGGAPLAEDVRRVAAVREAVGPEVRVMVDALYNLDVAAALALANAIAPYDIYFLEAPVSPYDVEGQARVHARSPMPVCGNEHQCWAVNFKRLITAQAVHFVQFDLAVCGGVTEGRRIAALAHVFHLPCTLHAASSAVLFAASLHVAAACPNCESIEYHMLHQWLWDRVPDGTFALVDRKMRPPEGPGIGIALTPDDV